MSLLEGKVALVTGAGAGLGQAIVVQLAKAGADVATIDLNEDATHETLDRIKAFDVAASSYVCDVADSAQVDRTWAAVAKDFGRLDIVVNNAGVSFIGPPIIETSDEAWHKSIAVMQTGVFYGMRAAARLMIAQGSGSVVNISSIRGFSPNPGRIAYCAAKAAVLMMTKVAAGEWAPYGVRANAIAPGVQKTPMWDADVAKGLFDEGEFLKLIPAGTLGDPNDVGELVVYLSSDAAKYMNGSCITIDGALTSVPLG